MLRYVLFIISIFVICNFVYGQDNNTKLDSLLNDYHTSTEQIKDSILLRIAKYYYDNQNYNHAEMFFKLAIKKSSKQKKYLNKCLGYYYLAKVKKEKGLFDSLYYYVDKAIITSDSIKDKSFKSFLLNYAANSAIDIAEYDKAFDYFFKNVKYTKQINDSAALGTSYRNLGLVYELINDTNKALEMYQKALNIYHSVKDTASIWMILQDIGVVYGMKNMLNKARENFNQALEIYKTVNDSEGLASIYSNLGQICFIDSNYKKALDYFIKSLNIAEKLNNNHLKASSLYSIGSVYAVWKKYFTALDYYKQGLKISENNNMNANLYKGYYDISEIYNKLNDKRNACIYYKNYIYYKDSVFNEKTQRQINELKTKYNNYQQQQEIELLNKEKKLNDLQIIKTDKELHKKNILLIFILLGFFLIAVFMAILYRINRQIKKANRILRTQNQKIVLQNTKIEQQRNEIEQQRDYIVEQRDLIAEQKKEITDSIAYAEKIQNAIIPDVQIQSQITGQFVLFIPKDVVSGDFYMITSKNNDTLFIAADCTGHGVPGAFMSMLGINLIHEIITKYNHVKPDFLLEELRKKVIFTLKQTEQHAIKDSMDISICQINKNADLMLVSGAYNPVYLIRDKVLTEIKNQKIPVGISEKLDIPFTMQKINLQKNDCIYLFSDGYADQFGGHKNKKYKYKNFKEKLIEISDYEMNVQKQMLTKEFYNWKGINEQVDDILVIGIKI